MNKDFLSRQSKTQTDLPRTTWEGTDASEIRVSELLAAIGKHGKLVVLSMLAGVILAVGYVLLAEPVYRSEVHLLPPRQRDIQELVVKTRSVAETSEQGVFAEYDSPEPVFAKMLQNLNSQGLRREFFDDNKLIEFYTSGSRDEQVNVNRIFNKRFNSAFTVDKESDDTHLVVASFAYSDPELAAKWLNDYVALANGRAVEQLVSDVEVEIKAEAERVRVWLTRMRNTARQARADRIMELREALRIAKVLGISDTSDLSVVSRTLPRGGVAINTAALPLYMRGTKALSEEIAVLESRKSDEAFIKGYRAMQNKLNALESMNIDEKSLSSVRVDVPAVVAYRAERPNKPLIVVSGLMFGVVVGVLLAFLAEYRYRARRSS